MKIPRTATSNEMRAAIIDDIIDSARNDLAFLRDIITRHVNGSIGDNDLQQVCEDADLFTEPCRSCGLPDGKHDLLIPHA